MAHRVIVEVLQADGRTLEVTPAGGVRTTAPVLPRGEVLELGGQEYIVLAIRQSLSGWQGLDDWRAVTTYLVDEAVAADEASGVDPADRQFVAIVEQSWPAVNEGEAA